MYRDRSRRVGNRSARVVSAGDAADKGLAVVRALNALAGVQHAVLRDGDVPDRAVVLTGDDADELRTLNGVLHLDAQIFNHAAVDGKQAPVGAAVAAGEAGDGIAVAVEITGERHIVAGCPAQRRPVGGDGDVVCKEVVLR